MKLQTHSSSDIRLEILRTAADLFHSRGLWSTTTDEIVEAAGIPKAEFHQHFKSKSEVARAALRYYFEELAAGIGPVKYELNSWQDLEECLSSHVEFQKKFKMTRSCPIGALGSELKERDDLTREALTLILDLMLTRLESFFSREKIAGRLASTADVEQLANFCVATIQGAMLAGKIRRNCGCVENVFEDLLQHLKWYATAPAKRRLCGDTSRNGLSARSKPLRPPTVVILPDAANTVDARKNRDASENQPSTLESDSRALSLRSVSTQVHRKISEDTPHAPGVPSHLADEHRPLYRGNTKFR